MRLFGSENTPADAAKVIADFWTWWAKARPEIDAQVEAGNAEAIAEALESAVNAMHPSLVWEIAPGGTARYALVVSACNDPELRSFTHRWALAAPPDGELWEFHPSRQAKPQAAELSVEVEGREFDLNRLVVAVQAPPNAPRAEISVFHPIFPDLEDEARMDASLMALDWLLGEDEVARWVGEIVPAEFEPIDAFPAIHLPGVIADLAKGFVEEQWMLMEGTTPTGSRVTALARYPLRPVDHPLNDQHIAIGLPYRNSDSDGQPSGGSLDALRDFEERLTGLLGTLGTAVLAAHMSADGRRTLHVYADPEGEAASAINELAATWKEGEAEVEVADDPSWSEVAHFLT
ncbi:DUF695 domain-containing protein [Sphaerimonospora sp. CA-214678]|uniref:DUF695 domain-containing protein n=1 Tax=Sphaerimonospora sp. CA-214678 TaxID=3240029 RepID=UPI003D90B594